VHFRASALLPLNLCRHRATRASCHPTKKAVINHGQQHQRRDAFRAWSVSPTWTDRQGRSTLCDRGGVRERTRTGQSAQRRVCGTRAWGLGHVYRVLRGLVDEGDANYAVR